MGVLILPNHNYKHTITIFNKYKLDMDGGSFNSESQGVSLNGGYFVPWDNVVTIDYGTFADGNQKEAWKKTVINGCFFKCETNTTFTGTTSSKSNTYTVRIPGKKEYKENKNFCGGEGFTLKEGDICILGACDDSITGKTGKTATDILNKNKPNAFKITSVSDNNAFIGAHFRIGG